MVVDYTAKVQIFEQITTSPIISIYLIELLIIPQRYKFSSKSQQLSLLIINFNVVDYTAKVQIFEQITTESRCQRMQLLVVDYTAKVQIFEQITAQWRLTLLFSTP